MIKWFHEIIPSDLVRVGGKGYQLAKLAKKFRVPDGFIILSDAYDQYIHDNDFREKIENLIHHSQNPLKASEDIKALFTLEQMNQELQDRIKREFEKITTGRVAVRSSSTMEDLPEMSFAGQYNSYLNVSGENLLEKIIQCWQSIWNERAIRYRQMNKVSKDFSHCVIVQTMVDAVSSGVVFTANPISGNRNELVINASYGLGEAIVSGQVNPDQYVVNKDSGYIESKNIRHKEIMLKISREGIIQLNVSSKLAKESSLSQAEVNELWKVCLQIERIYGKPQDIEFAFDNKEQLYVLQTRDITTLFPMDSLLKEDKRRAYLGVGTVMLGMKEPFTPLGFQVMSNMFPTILNIMAKPKKPLTNDFMKYVGNRMFADVTYLMSSKWVSKQFAKAFSGNDLPLKDVFDEVIEKYGYDFTHQSIRFKIPWGILKYSASMVKKMNEIRKIPMEKRYEAMIQLGNKVYQQQYDKYRRLSSVEEKLAFNNEALVEAFKLSQSQGLYCIEINHFNGIKKQFNRMYGDQYNPEILLHTLPGCFSQELTIKLNELAMYFDEKGLESDPHHPHFKKILERFGHRGNMELDFGTPRWREEPDFLVKQVQSYMKDKMYERNLRDIENKKKDAEEFIHKVYCETKKRFGRRKAESLRKKMLDFRVATGMREYPKSDIVRILELGRRATLSIGDDYVKEGLIEHSEDIFYLFKEDILKKESLANKVKQNKSNYNKEKKRNNIPRIIINNGETYYSSKKIQPNSHSMQGIPLSPGVYEGVIRVVHDPLYAELKEGEIMVAESTNPAWTPLFATAGGLILEYGGPMSHGGIVAREYGLPAVVGISSATTVLKDGQKVRINGENGVVEFI